MDDPLALALGTLVVLLAIGVGVLKFYRRFRKAAESAQARIFQDRRVAWEPTKGLVAVTFHTYYGFLGFTTQTEHRFWASPEDAREILWRLLSFNLRWGWLGAGSLLAIPLSVISYLSQTRSIRSQDAEQNRSASA